MIEKGIEMSQINVQKTNEDFAVPWLVFLDMLDMLKTNFSNNNSLLLHRPQAVLDVLDKFIST